MTDTERIIAATQGVHPDEVIGILASMIGHGTAGVDHALACLAESRERQPRDHAVTCTICRRPTWNHTPICDRCVSDQAANDDERGAHQDELEQAGAA